MGTPKTTKTLVTKFNTDVSQMNDAQIDAFKAFYKAMFAESGLELSFELLINDEAEQALDLYQRIQQEFKLPGQTPSSSTAQTSTKKASDPFGKLSKLFEEFGKLMEDEG